MNKFKTSKIIAVIIVVIMASAVGAFLYSKLITISEDNKEKEELAQCLTEKGAVMYGAFWCPHCKDQKDAFGKQAFKKIKYIECDSRGPNAQPELCQKMEIKVYPTWIINGEVLPGFISLERLAETTGCNFFNN